MHASASLPSSPPPLLVLERAKEPSPQPPRAWRADPTAEADPSPHAHETSCCPVVDARPDETYAGRRRAKKKPKPKTRAAPAFWRPTLGMGGKSLGYAWGYAGSNPLPADADAHEGGRYERDTMRKAVFAA